MAEPLIVGIDPGNTSAVAAINLEGEIELLESRREFPHDDIILELVKTGKPVLVACDTRKMPSTVKNIASSLGAERFEPEEDLETRRKKQLGEGKNSHEIDAVASAVYAYNNHQRKIRKIEAESEKPGKDRETVAESYFGS